jgi:protein required for attachment to host cells
MSSLIPPNALVVVADGGKAILFRRTGAGADVTLREERKLTPDTIREQGPSGSRPEEQTQQQTEEASFNNHLSHVLHSMHQHGEYDSLVLVLDPQSLGQLRGSLHSSVTAAVVRTLAKDLTNHSTKEIEHALSD